jgi:hypothetical protein
MKHTPMTLLATTLVAGCLSAGAWAADNAKSGTKSTMPAADAQQGTQPSAQNMDANAQRAHSRSTGTEPGNADAAKSKGATGGSDSTSQTVAQGGTRDWSQVDTDHDNLVSPDEMQKYLDQAHGQKSGGSTSSSTSTTNSTSSATPAPKQ